MAAGDDVVAVWADAGTAFYDYSRNITVSAFEPGVRSTGNVISGNSLAGAHGNGTIWGIRIDMSDDALITNNNVIDLQPKDGGYAAAIVTDSATSRPHETVGKGPGNRVFSISCHCRHATPCRNNCGGREPGSWPLGRQAKKHPAAGAAGCGVPVRAWRERSITSPSEQRP